MKIIALTFAAVLAGLSLTAPVTVDADQGAPLAALEAAENPLAGAEAPEAAALPAPHPSPSSVFVYHDSGVRDPFVPLILPTPVPVQNLVDSLTESQPDPVDEAVAANEKPLPTPTPVVLPEDIQIQCILWSPDQQIAIIDEAFAQVGDTLGEVTIAAIHEKSVDVVYEGVQFTLNLSDPLDELSKVDTSKSTKKSVGFKSRSRR